MSKKTQKQASEWKLLWGDMHSNLHSERIGELDKWYEYAKDMVDFWPIAYYPYHMYKGESGMPLEGPLAKERYQGDWEILRTFTKRKNDAQEHPVMFMGYEWQGNGGYGDHNVFFAQNDGEIQLPDTYPELVDCLPRRQAMAVPHHLAYERHNRGKDWDTHNEEISPLVEIYSHHGSSEDSVVEQPMERHIHMGPRSGGTSVMDGLKRGYRFGIIASGDNHVVPVQYGNGMMACYTQDGSKDGIWSALQARRTYGVSGNRIELMYTINGHMMGEEFTAKGPYTHDIKVCAGTAIKRVEIIRNGILCDTYVHSGKWEEHKYSNMVRFKFRAEFGWGPNVKVFPEITERKWDIKISTTGSIQSIEPCWTSFGQKIVQQDDKSCQLNLTTRKGAQVTWMGPVGLANESCIIEMEAELCSSVVFEIEGEYHEVPVAELLERSMIIGLEKEARELIKERFGVTEFKRSDSLWGHMYKVKLHRAVPEVGYNCHVHLETDYVPSPTDFYMVKVYQVDGHLAWSSPIWVNSSPETGSKKSSNA